MDELTEDFERLVKISAFRKLSKINQNQLCKDVTIGPNAVKSPSPVKTQSKNEKSPHYDDRRKDHKENIESDSPLSEYALIREMYNIKRHEERNKALNKRIEAFERFSKQQEDERKEKWLRTQQAFIDDMEKQEINIAKANQQLDLKNSTQQAKLVRQYQEAALRIKQKQALKECIEKVKRNQSQFISEYEQIFGILRSCKDNVELRDLLGQDTELLKSLPEQMDLLVSSCKSSTISDREVDTSLDILHRITNLKNRFKKTVEEINQRIDAKKVEPKTQEVVFRDTISTSAVETTSNTISNQTAPAIQTLSLSSTVTVQKPVLGKVTGVPNIARNKIEKYVSMTNLKIYTDILEFLENHKQSFNQLEQDVSMKQFKFDCKKAVNISVNALSGANAEHILDKYRKLHRLLSGQSIIVSDKEVNASRHPQGIAFCMDLLAKKFVLQGDLMVSNKPEYAFCYASLIITLWNDFPNFGNLVLAYFYQSCPYLVPYHIPKQVDDSDIEYYSKLGYQYNSEGQIESQDKFLKRMTGMIRLYTAILITKPKRGQNTHPHNLKNGWRWLASTLKLEPQIDISATAVHAFLETVGFELEARYGPIFQKLIRIVMTVFLDKCRKAKSIDGPITRLESLLSDYLKDKRFSKPDGYVDHAYW